MYRYSEYLSLTFPGIKVQRITVDGGFTCPNRDGSKGVGGCSFCNPAAFIPSFCRNIHDIHAQIEAGKAFFAHKHKPSERIGYLVYFQSYSGTYATIAELIDRYNAALSSDHVLGIVIGTRPDCITDEVLDLLATIHQSHYVMIEYGVESCYDKTLARVGRGHDFACSCQAILRTAQRGIPTGVHLILGLPDETDAEMLHEADILSTLPIQVLKLHQLQIMQGTRLAEEWQQYPERFQLFSAKQYACFVAKFINRLRPDIALDRFVAEAPSHLLLAPRWGLKPDVVQQMVEQEYSKLNL